MENHDLRISSSSNKSLPNIKIVTWSELDIRAQEAAFRAIASINMQTSTEEGTTWEKYTVLIQDRLQNCKGAKDTFFIAQVPDTGQFIGYCAFYTVKDLLPYPSRFLLGDENRAYCSWTAVDPKFRGQGIAEKLKQQLFCPDHAFTSFVSHVKKTNQASQRTFEKLSTAGYTVTRESEGHQWRYTVVKLPSTHL